MTMVLCIYLTLTSFMSTATIQIHTDNGQDLYSFETLKPLSLSAETNLAVLALPKKNLHVSLAPLKRSMKFMDRFEPVCVINKIMTPERSKKYLFSKPVNLFFNRRLYQTSTLPALNDTDAVDLLALFKKYPERKLIISSQLSYGEKLDTILSQLPRKNVMVRESGLQGIGMIEMFAQNRGDYAIFHPQELVGLTVDLKATNYEIANTEPYVVGRLMCSNTPQTKAYLAEINAHIDRLVATKKLYAAHLKYIDKEYQAVFKQYYENVFTVLQY